MFASAAKTQTPFPPSLVKEAEGINRSVVLAIRQSDVRTIIGMLSPEANFDTARLKETVLRYSPAVSNDSLAYSMRKQQYATQAWKQVIHFDNKWTSSDRQETINIEVIVAFRGMDFVIVAIMFNQKNVPMTWPAKGHAADSLAGIIIEAMKGKKWSTIYNLYRPDLSIDKSHLKNFLAAYGAASQDTSLDYIHDFDPTYERFPDDGFIPWNAVSSHRWTVDGEMQFYITLYFEECDGRLCISQMVFTSNRRDLHSAAFPGGTFSPPRESDDIPPPPPPPPPPGN